MAVYKDKGLDPIISQRPPTTKDRAPIGQTWIDENLDDVYTLTSIKNNISNWIGVAGGSGTFSSLNVTPGALTVTGGNFSVTAGTVTFGAFGKGLVFSSATGLISYSAGANGQVVIGKTGDSPIWATLTAGAGINITNGANSIQIDATGATAVKYTTDDANIVIPDGVGNINVVGGSNIATTGAIANTITIDLDSTISVAGKITAGNDFEMTTGTFLVESDDNAANAIYLHANGGVNETIHLYSQKGTGVASLNFESLLGGIYLSAGTALSLNAATASEINITNNSFAINTGTGALNLGTDAFAKTVTLGSTAGASSSVVQCGTGALNITGGGAMTLSAAGLLKIDSSGGRIDIGTDVVAQNINIGTSASVRTVTIGNSTGASSVIVDCGSGNADFGVSATSPHQTRIGSTHTTSNTTVQSGTGLLAINGLGSVTIDSVGALELNASAGAVNIMTDAVAATTTIGNITGASSIDIRCGTGAANFAASATDHTTIVGSLTGVSASTFRSGTGALTLAGLGAVTLSGVTTLDIDTGGALTINSSGSSINIGNDVVTQAVNIATGGERILTLGSSTTASQTVVHCGTAGASFGADANAHVTTIGSTNTTSQTIIQAGSNGLALNAAGIATLEPAVDSQAGAAVTINANVGVGTFTGLTTAAGSSQVFTITNSICTATSAIMCTLANKGANDAQMTVQRVIPGAGSFTVTAKNNGAAALNGDVIITFWIIKAS